jgi:hypothetical protein
MSVKKGKRRARDSLTDKPQFEAEALREMLTKKVLALQL